MAVASDSAQLDRMMESVINTSCGRCLYAGYGRTTERPVHSESRPQLQIPLFSLIENTSYLVWRQGLHAVTPLLFNDNLERLNCWWAASQQLLWNDNVRRTTWQHAGVDTGCQYWRIHCHHPHHDYLLRETMLLLCCKFSIIIYCC